MNSAERFSDRADAYALGRPDYPRAVYDAVLADAVEPRVVDLGAGTGIASRGLVAHAAQPLVTALEPNRAMRERGRESPRSRLTWVDGTAEATGLATASMDIVVAFQAWHWFDHKRAFAEALRVLRPTGGRIVVVYNERDKRDEFTSIYGEIVRRYATDRTELIRLAAARMFNDEGARPMTFPHVQQLTRAGLHSRAASTSYLPHSGPAAESLHQEIDAIVDAHGEDDLALRYMTNVFFVQR